MRMGFLAVQDPEIILLAPTESRCAIISL